MLNINEFYSETELELRDLEMGIRLYLNKCVISSPELVDDLADRIDICISAIHKQ
jgi:hypothetical protein